jgi:hypothetical protein
MMANGKMGYHMVVVGLSTMMVLYIRVVLSKDLLSVEMLYLLNKMELIIKDR